MFVKGNMASDKDVRREIKCIGCYWMQYTSQF